MANDSSNANVAKPDLADSSLSKAAFRMADRGLFLKKFLAKGRTISSVTPSSRALVERVLQPVDFSRPATIVELGAGTGAVTEQLMERLKPHHRFVAVENDADFCQVFRRRFPEAMLLQTDASRISEPLARMGITKVDYVISGLPTPNLPRTATVRLWRWLRDTLAPNGLFSQITVVPLVYAGFYERLFESVSYRMAWLNLPPGGVYWCRKPRASLASRV